MTHLGGQGACSPIACSEINSGALSVVITYWMIAMYNECTKVQNPRCTWVHESLKAHTLHLLFTLTESIRKTLGNG